MCRPAFSSAMSHSSHETARTPISKGPAEISCESPLLPPNMYRVRPSQHSEFGPYVAAVSLEMVPALPVREEDGMLSSSSGGGKDGGHSIAGSMTLSITLKEAGSIA